MNEWVRRATCRDDGAIDFVGVRTEPEDFSTIFRRARSGDGNAMAALWNSLEDEILAGVKKRSGPVVLREKSPEDIVQDLFGEISRSIAAMPDNLDRKTFLARVLGRARFRILDAAKGVAKRPKQNEADLEMLARHLTGTGVVTRGDDIRRIRESVDKLPTIFAEFIRLHVFENRGLPEIAEMLGVPVGTLRKRHLRAIKLLRELLTPPPVDGRG